MLQLDTTLPNLVKPDQASTKFLHSVSAHIHGNLTTENFTEHSKTNSNRNTKCAARAAGVLHPSLLLTACPFITDSQVSNAVKTTAMENVPPEGTLNRSFIEAQLKAIEKDKRGMRWQPMSIRWAMAIKHCSKSAYMKS